MKNTIICFILCTAIFTMCEKDTHQTSISKNITYLQSQPGGCNGMAENDFKNAAIETDTLTFNVKNDTLDVFVGINYICCAPFITETKISNDSLLITITDTCPIEQGSCYCRCMCYYTWNFFFSGISKKAYPYKIMLNDPRNAETTIFNEGMIDLSE